MAGNPSIPELGASREKGALQNKGRIKDSLGLVIEGSPIHSLIQS